MRLTIFGTRLLFVLASAVTFISCSEFKSALSKETPTKNLLKTTEITDKEVRSEPPLPRLPPAGGTYVDPVFGSNIMRVTDAGDGTDCTVAYSYWPSFNLNSTRLHLRCDNRSLLYTFDPLNFRWVSKEPLFSGSTPNGSVGNWEDSIWSGRDPNILFTHDLNNLWAYNVANKTYTLAGGIQSLIPAGHHIFQMSKSTDDNVFAWTEKDANYTNVGYLVYRRDSNQIIYRVPTTQLDEVEIDKSGKYLVVKTGLESSQGQTRVIVVNLASGSPTNLSNGAPDYACGHSDNGDAFTVGSDNFNNSIQYRSLSSPRSNSSLLSFGNDWSFAVHISSLANDPSWALVSTYTTSNRDPGLYHNEIFQVATDGSQRVRRLVHHRSVYTNYYDSPRANISWDGQFVAYTSNWGGSSRRDVFVAKIPVGESGGSNLPPVPPPEPPAAAPPAPNISAAPKKPSLFCRIFIFKWMCGKPKNN